MLECRLYPAVDRKLGYREEFCPVILTLASKDPKVLFDLFVHSLSLTVRLGVICRRKLAVDAKLLVQRFDRLGCKLRAAIRDEASREPVETEDVANMEVRNAISVDCVVGKREVGLLAIEVDVSGDGVVRLAVDSLARGQSGDEVQACM